VTRISILLIMIALIAGTVGCIRVNYDLTIASTSGGSVTAPGEGTFTYGQGRVVRLVARPCLGYTFVRWTGDVTTITTVNSFSTTIIMDENCSITANFDCACGG
jgi:uncharacterized repeat protein (TIGR02543 family)